MFQKTHVPVPMLSDGYPTNSRLAEAYRTLRTNINFSFLEEEFGSLLITSAGEKEGKTTTVANLSFTMAQAGKTVLMVDADLRKPALTRKIKAQNSLGLSGLLSNTFGTEVRSGTLEKFGVSDLFWLLSFQKRTGVLRLSQQKERIELYFLKGELVDVQWLTRPESKRLATLLVKNNMVSKEQAEMALSRAKGTGQKLGFILINMGLVDKNGLEGMISLHMIEALRTSLQFRSGEFAFEKLPETHFDRPSFDPADLPKLYKQVLVGEEKLPFLHNKIQSAIVKTPTDNLFLLPSGPIPPNPAELLDSKWVTFLLSFLKRRFDRVMIDTPPVLPASDALILSRHTDGVVLIIRAGDLNRDMIQKAVSQIQHAQANVVGVVLNQVNVRREGYYKYYHKYYSSGYYGAST